MARDNRTSQSTDLGSGGSDGLSIERKCIRRNERAEEIARHPRRYSSGRRTKLTGNGGRGLSSDRGVIPRAGGRNSPETVAAVYPQFASSIENCEPGGSAAVTRSPASHPDRKSTR